ncbi:Proline-rich receptor-like protein kinase PERK8, partial [Linum grandiflorum]
DQADDPKNLLFRSYTFPRYCRKFYPASQTKYIPATPRAYVVINYSSGTPSNSDDINSCISSPSLSGASSFFFTISSSSSSPSSSSPLSFRFHYRCTFRGSEAIGFRRMVPPDVIIGGQEKLKRHLSAISALRHANVVQLIGASVSEMKEQCTTLELIYQFVPGPTLSDCLNTSGKAAGDANDPYRHVSTWKSRMEIALGVASGLVYIHHMTGFDIVFVHNRIKSSNIILTSAASGNSPLIRAKICNFGLSRAGWRAVNNNNDNDNLGEHQRVMKEEGEEEEEEGYPYMAPELLQEGISSQKSDVYAFGVLLLELLSGTSPSAHRRAAPASIIETSAAIFGGGTEGAEVEEIEKRVRLWVDKRLNDSFPVKSTVELLRVALMCVVDDPASRPDMASVEGFLFRCIRSFRTQSFPGGDGVLSGGPSLLNGR